MKPLFIQMDSLGILQWRWQQLAGERNSKRRKRLIAGFAAILAELRLVPVDRISAVGFGYSAAGDPGLIVVFDEAEVREADK